MPEKNEPFLGTPCTPSFKEVTYVEIPEGITLTWDSCTRILRATEENFWTRPEMVLKPSYLEKPDGEQWQTVIDTNKGAPGISTTFSPFGRPSIKATGNNTTGDAMLIVPVDGNIRDGNLVIDQVSRFTVTEWLGIALLAAAAIATPTVLAIRTRIQKARERQKIAHERDIQDANRQAAENKHAENLRLTDKARIEAKLNDMAQIPANRNNGQLVKIADTLSRDPKLEPLLYKQLQKYTEKHIPLTPDNIVLALATVRSRLELNSRK